jgi:ketosteroid isomerase-like protein
MDWMFRWRVEDGRIALFDSYVDSAVITAAMS